MPMYQCEPGVELNGTTASALVFNIRHFEMEPILEAHNLNTIDHEAWYPLQDILDVLKAIGDGYDASTNFVSIGMKAAEISLQVLSPQLKDVTVEQFLTAYPGVYQSRHRGGRAGNVYIEKFNTQEFRITLDDFPYPDDVFYGIFYQYVRHLLPPETDFTVMYETNRQHDGGDQSVINISWH